MKAETNEYFTLPEDLKNAGWYTGELKPCPFCGNDQILTAGERNPTSGNIVYKVFCTDLICSANVHACLGKEDKAVESRAAAVAKWNKRTNQ